MSASSSACRTRETAPKGSYSCANPFAMPCLSAWQSSFTRGGAAFALRLPLRVRASARTAAVLIGVGAVKAQVSRRQGLLEMPEAAVERIA